MRLKFVAIALVVASSTLLLSASKAQAFHRCHCTDCTDCRNAETGRPDLFRNYYVDPNCGGVGAQMYLAPHPVPPLVGRTYFTYQPLMPHEFLYQHKRSYHRYYNEGRGFTRTHVRWR